MQKIDKIQEIYDRVWYNTDLQNKFDVYKSDDEREKGHWLFKHSKLNLKELNKISFFEIGSGMGTFYHFIKTQGVVNYDCCDTNDNVIKAFKHYFPEKKDSIIHKDALSALKDLPDKKFDCVIAFMVLEHLSNDYFTDLFREAVNKLKPGGEFWIHVPCAESILSAYPLYYDLSHKRSFVLNNFITLAAMHNLEIVAKTGRLIAVTNAKTLIKYLHEKFIYLLNRFLFLFMISVRAKNGVFSSELTVILRKPK